jgi:lauroyl/myristoyl acyltransferase
VVGRLAARHHGSRCPVAGAAMMAVAAEAKRAYRRVLEVAFLIVLNASLHALSFLPYRTRRRGLRTAFTCLGAILGGLDLDSSSQAFATILALSKRDGRKFTGRKLYYDMVAMVEWLALGRRTVRGLAKDIRHLSSEGCEDLQWLAAQRGAVIGTMHFGPYALGLVWLIHSYFQNRKIFIFKNSNATEEARAIARLGKLGAEVEFIAPSALVEFHRLIKEVRQGAIVIIMVDLPPAATRSDAFDLLGREVSVATGAVDLAALGRAPLMLLRVRAGKGGDQVEIGDVFEVAHHDAGSRSRAASRIAQFVTDTLHCYPEQWHMWSRFGEYLPVPSRIAS